MDTKLLDQILGAARTSATGSEAMRIEDLQRDLTPLLEVLDTEDCDEPMNVAAYVADFKALAGHIMEPLDGDGIDQETGEVEDQAVFSEWCQTLYRLAQ